MSRPDNGLLPQHMEKLKSSAVSEEVWQARAYRSIEDDEAFQSPDWGGGSRTRGPWVGPEAPGSWALREVGFQHYAWRTPGLLIPVWSVTGEIGTYQYRPDDPRMRNGQPIKYENIEGQPHMIDVPPAVYPHIGNPKKPLIITEGILKADAAVSAGALCIALTGVWDWKGRNIFNATAVLQEFDDIVHKDRLFYLAFDSDYSKNSKVGQALERLGAMLRRRGAQVRYCRLQPSSEGSKVGLDDFLAAGGSLEDLASDAVDEIQTRRTFELTDTGNAERIVEACGEDIRYCHPHKRWYVWNGRYWEPDATAAIQQMTKDTVRSIHVEALKIIDDAERAKVRKWGTTSESAPRRKAMAEAASWELGVAIRPDELDTDPWLFNCENGTIDLRTGDLLPHSRDDFITRMAPVRFDLSARDERWGAFVRQVTDGDVEYGLFLQRAAYVSLSGSVTDKTFLFLCGETDTGKSTFVVLLSAAIGPYAGTVDFDAFLKRSYTGGIRSDIASMEGKRLVSSVEVDHGNKLSEGMIKLLSGGDKIQMQRKFENPWEASPTFTLWLAANEVPKIRTDDEAIWNRARFLPFDHKPKKIDRTWTERMAADPGFRAAVLAWAMRGRLGWQAQGIGSCSVIDRKTAEVRGDMDPLKEFWEDCCEFGPKLWTSSSRLQSALKRWSTRRDRPVINQSDLGRLLRKHKCRPETRDMTIEAQDGTQQTRKTRGWLGLDAREV
jgi:P4 family phage/plasmid primase-like protien